MTTVLLDQNVPEGVKAWRGSKGATTAYELGWHELRNGDLIAAVERRGFRPVTCDENLRYQQKARPRAVPIVVLPTNNWLRDARGPVLDAIARASALPGAYVDMDVDLPQAP